MSNRDEYSINLTILFPRAVEFKTKLFNFDISREKFSKLFTLKGYNQNYKNCVYLGE